MRRPPFSTALFVFIVCCVSAALAPTAYAKEGPGTKAIRQTNDSIQTLLAKRTSVGSKEEQALEAQIAQEVRRVLDADELGRRALKDHIGTLPKKDVQTFLSLLRELIEQSYAKALRAQLAYEVKYLEETGTKERTVATEVHTTRKNKPYVIEIEYQLRKEASGWRVYDVVTDGVGLVRNYRAQFNRIIAKEGFDGLLARMQKRRDSFEDQ